MNLPQRILATTLAQVGGKVALGLAAIVSLRLTTGYLGVEGFGEFAIVLALVPFLAVALGLAVGAIGNRLYTVSGDGQSAGNGIEHSAVPFNEILQVDLVLK